MILRPVPAVLPDGRPARAAGVHTPFYCFAWLSRWSRTKFHADQRKARTIPYRHDRYTRHEVTAPRVAGPSGRTCSCLGGGDWNRTSVAERTLKVVGGGDWNRTSDLRVMSPSL